MTQWTAKVADARLAKSGASDSLLLLGARVIAVLAGVGVQSCLAWLLLPAGRGSYAVAVLFSSVVAVIVGVGLDKAVQYYISSSLMSLSAAVANLLALSGLAAATAIPLGLALLQWDLAIWDKADRASLVLMLCFAPLSSLTLSLRWALIGTKRFGQFAISTCLVAVLQFVAVLVFVGLFKWGVNGALLALVLSTIATGAHNVVVLRRRCGLHYQRPTVRGITQLLGYGGKYYLASIGYMANTRIGIVLVAFFLNPEEIGYFAAAVGIVLQAGMISDSVETAVLPRMAQDAPRRAELAGQAARLTFLATGIPLGLFAIFCRPMIALLFSKEFLPSVPLVLIVLPGLLLWSAGKILLAYFLSRGTPGVASWTIGVGIAVNAASLLVLLPSYGLSGAAMAMSLGFAARWVVASSAFHKASGVGIRSTWFPKRSDFALLWGLLPVRQLRRG